MIRAHKRGPCWIFPEEHLGREYILAESSLAELSHSRRRFDAGLGREGSGRLLLPWYAWAADGSWLFVQDIDWTYAVVAGSHELVADVVATVELNAREVRGNTFMPWS